MLSIKKWLGGTRLKCAAVTPVGPGHAERALECRASIEAAWRGDPGPFSRLDFHFIDDTRGELGRSRARNVGVRAARDAGADWIFFLDADDLMTPRAFSIFAGYADRFDAVWGLMAIKPPDAAEYHIRFPQALTLQSVDELLLLDPFMTLLMGHFVRTSVASELPFDENMDAGEDFDYYIRAWEKHRCTKIAQVLSVNRSDRHSSGPRAATADQWRIAATARLAAGLQKRNLQRDSARAIAALNRCSEEAQVFNRARAEAGAEDLATVCRRLPYRGRVEISGCAGGNFVMFSDNDDSVALSVAWTGEYLPASTRLWQALATSAPSILDIGANTGYFGLLAARASPAAAIVCLEPRASNFTRLELNLALNNAHNIRAVRVAAAGASVPDGSVDTVSIDSFLKAECSVIPALVRIDAPEMAAEVLAGMARTLQVATPDFLIAVGDAGCAERLNHELKQRGYRFYAIDEDKSSIVATERLTPAGGIASVNRWATMRPPDDVARVVAMAYCDPGGIAGC